MKVERERFEEVLAMVRSEFPRLTVVVDRDHPHVDAMAELPVQPGLDFLVNFNLQGDELHLGSSHFWCEWFPCGSQRVHDEFKAAVRGVLPGQFWIRESFVLGRPSSARLQRPESSGGSKTVATRRKVRSFLPLPRAHRIVQNRPSS